VKSTHFINSKGESARSEAVLVDGITLVRSFNDLKNSKSNQMKHKLINASPSYLPIVQFNGNSFESAIELSNPFVALGSGVRYGLISNNHFVYNNTSQNKKNALINFESA
jgi:polyribonucleotide nucleotidyltransferase